MKYTKAIRSIVAGLIVLSFFGTWLSMMWTGKDPDSLLLVGAISILFASGYYLWGDAMGKGIDAAEED